MRAVTLIIDKRREISIKYKKLLENEDNIVIIARDSISALKFIQDNEPDLIIISDSIDNDLSEYCQKIRGLTYNMRPIIVATSKSSDVEDRLNVLESGADDFMSEPVNPQEFVMRLKVHLRREFESNLDEKKLLPNRNYTLRAIKRTLTKQEPWACLYISIDNIKSYTEAYSELASDKLLQTFCAIGVSALSKNDYFGSLGNNKFLIITDQLKAEKIGSFLVNAFDGILPKFYSAEDFNRGYVITNSDETVGFRSNFVRLSIGIVTNEFEPYSKPSALIPALEEMCDMARLNSKSNYLAERAKLSAQDSIINSGFNNTIAIFEKDEAMQILLKTVLEFQGYEIFQISTKNDIESITTIPAVVIIDAGDNSELDGLEFCKNLRANNMYNNVKIIITTNIHNKEMVLDTGADIYIPKPYDLPYLVNVVRKFIKEINK